MADCLDRYAELFDSLEEKSNLPETQQLMLEMEELLLSSLSDDEKRSIIQEKIKSFQDAKTVTGDDVVDNNNRAYVYEAKTQLKQIMGELQSIYNEHSNFDGKKLSKFFNDVFVETFGDDVSDTIKNNLNVVNDVILNNVDKTGDIVTTHAVIRGVLNTNNQKKTARQLLLLAYSKTFNNAMKSRIGVPEKISTMNNHFNILYDMYRSFDTQDRIITPKNFNEVIKDNLSSRHVLPENAKSYEDAQKNFKYYEDALKINEVVENEIFDVTRNALNEYINEDITKIDDNVVAGLKAKIKEAFVEKGVGDREAENVSNIFSLITRNFFNTIGANVDVDGDYAYNALRDLGYTDYFSDKVRNQVLSFSKGLQKANKENIFGAVKIKMALSDTLQENDFFNIFMPNEDNQNQKNKIIEELDNSDSGIRAKLLSVFPEIKDVYYNTDLNKRTALLHALSQVIKRQANNVISQDNNLYTADKLLAEKEGNVDFDVNREKTYKVDDIIQNVLEGKTNESFFEYVLDSLSDTQINAMKHIIDYISKKKEVESESIVVNFSDDINLNKELSDIYNSIKITNNLLEFYFSKNFDMESYLGEDLGLSGRHSLLTILDELTKADPTIFNSTKNMLFQTQKELANFNNENVSKINNIKNITQKLLKNNVEEISKKLKQMKIIKKYIDVETEFKIPNTPYTLSFGNVLYYFLGNDKNKKVLLDKKLGNDKDNPKRVKQLKIIIKKFEGVFGKDGLNELKKAHDDLVNFWYPLQNIVSQREFGHALPKNNRYVPIQFINREGDRGVQISRTINPMLRNGSERSENAHNINTEYFQVMKRQFYSIGQAYFNRNIAVDMIEALELRRQFEGSIYGGADEHARLYDALQTQFLSALKQQSLTLDSLTRDDIGSTKEANHRSIRALLAGISPAVKTLSSSMLRSWLVKKHNLTPEQNTLANSMYDTVIKNVENIYEHGDLGELSKKMIDNGVLGKIDEGFEWAISNFLMRSARQINKSIIRSVVREGVGNGWDIQTIENRAIQVIAQTQPSSVSIANSAFMNRLISSHYLGLNNQLQKNTQLFHVISRQFGKRGEMLKGVKTKSLVAGSLAMYTGLSFLSYSGLASILTGNIGSVLTRALRNGLYATIPLLPQGHKTGYSSRSQNMVQSGGYGIETFFNILSSLGGNVLSIPASISTLYKFVKSFMPIIYNIDSANKPKPLDLSILENKNLKGLSKDDKSKIEAFIYLFNDVVKSDEIE